MQRLKAVTVALSMLLCLVFAGCETSKESYVLPVPVMGDELFSIQSGECAGKQNATRDGWFIGDTYLFNMLRVILNRK